MELHQLSSRNGSGNKIHPLNVDQTEKQAVTKDRLSCETISLGKIPSDVDGKVLVRRQLIVVVAVILVIMLLTGVMVPVVYTVIQDGTKGSVSATNSVKVESSIANKFESSIEQTSTIFKSGFVQRTEIIEMSFSGSMSNVLVTQTSSTDQIKSKDILLGSCLRISTTSSFGPIPSAGIRKDCKRNVDNGLASKKLNDSSWFCLSSTPYCVLTCNVPGHKSFRPVAKCDTSTGRYYGWSDCILINKCSINNPCDAANSQCIFDSPGIYHCECKHGYAGNGTICGEDTDLDGIPDRGLGCTSRLCLKDNCIKTPNYRQQNTNTSAVGGDACVDDDDNDGIEDEKDFCPKHFEPLNADLDGDLVGDVCDNCGGTTNTDQLNTDHDGFGDACDSDIDNDGLDNLLDNCLTVANPSQSDSDNDTIGDACDNCVDKANRDQLDDDGNMVGDACQSNDSDRDGIDDQVDNCLCKPNADQVDTDADKQGDECDDDIDNDGLSNIKDNCPWVNNTGQEDTNGNGMGDACENDEDGDSTPDLHDSFPIDARKNQTDFTNQLQIMKITITPQAVIMLNKEIFGHFEYTGTFQLIQPKTNESESLFGIVFGYQSNRNFYFITWRKTTEVIRASNRTHHKPISRKGLTFMKIKSTTRPGGQLFDALLESGPSKDQVTSSWHDSNCSIEYEKAYKWYLRHHPDSGEIHFKLLSKEGKISSFNLVDASYKGGRLGYFKYLREADIHLSKMEVKVLKPGYYAAILNRSSITIPPLHNFDNRTDANFTLVVKMKVKGVRNPVCNLSVTTFGNTSISTSPFKQSLDDEKDWSFIRSRTIEPEQGVTTGNGTGYFALMNAKNSRHGDRSQLVSEWFHVTTDCQVRFWFHLINPSNQGGTLLLELQQDTPHKPWDLLWAEQDIAGKISSFWQLYRKSLQKFDGQYVRIRITAIRGMSDSGDIALDDIDLSLCARPEGACTTDNKVDILKIISSEIPNLKVENGLLKIAENSSGTIPYDTYVNVVCQFHRKGRIEFGVGSTSSSYVNGNDAMDNEILINPNSTDTLTIEKIYILNTLSKRNFDIDEYVDESFVGVKAFFRFDAFNRGCIIANQVFTANRFFNANVTDFISFEGLSHTYIRVT